MPFSLVVALRFLREGRYQTVLIVGGVAVGVGVMVFLSALISGLQQSLIEQTLGTQAHVVVRPLEEAARPLLDRGELAVADRIERPAQRLRTIGSWPKVVEQVRQAPGVVAVAPTVAGAGFASRGTASKSIVLRGVDASSYDAVIPITPRLKQGAFRLGSGEAVIGVDLARELGVAAGDKLRLVNPEGRGEPFTVAGVFDLQNKDVNLRWVLVSIRSAQTLLDLSGDVSTIEATVSEVFQADETAEAVGRDTGLQVDSWMKLNKQLLVALRSQSSSSTMIQFFVIVAVALGIASVLVVSVVQKSKEIGILKAMGAPTRRITAVFVAEGFLVGISGSVLGSLLGAGLALLFANLATGPDGSPLFPVDLNLALFARATLIASATGVIAAVAPARRAAKLDPAVVIRNG